MKFIKAIFAFFTTRVENHALSHNLEECDKIIDHCNKLDGSREARRCADEDRARLMFHNTMAEIANEYQKEACDCMMERDIAQDRKEFMKKHGIE